MSNENVAAEYDVASANTVYLTCLFNGVDKKAVFAEEFSSYDEAEKYAKKTLVGEGVLSAIDKITIRKNHGNFSELLHEIDVTSYPI